MNPSRLSMRPEGLAGRIFGKLMEAMNEGAYRQALTILNPARDASVVEIGFGTGRFLELLLERLPAGRVAGVDPTSTMVEVARSRRSIRTAGGRADLRLGEAAHLPWADGTFDAAVALHSFQFWADPLCAAREVRRVLRPLGRVILVLREHPPGRAPTWLPNPISRSADETGGARTCLHEAGFLIQDDGSLPPASLIAMRP